MKKKLFITKKIKYAGVAVAALLALAPVASSVTVDSTPSVVQAAGYSKKDYQNATAIIPKKTINDVDPAIPAGVMYVMDPDEEGYDPDTNSYIIWPNDDDGGATTYVKASDVTPFNYKTNKSVKKYVNAYNKAAKKVKDNQAMGLKFKKNTAIYLESDKDSDPIFVGGYEDAIHVTKHTRKMKKNKILTVGSGKISKSDVIKYKGMYYYYLEAFRTDGKNNWENQYVFVPASRVKFTKVSDKKSDEVKYNLKY